MLPEARARIGGRIHTVPCGQNGRPLELGAQWIHGGCPANSIYNYALSRDLLGGRQPCRDEEEENKPAESLGMLAMPRGHHFTSEGRVLAAKAVSQAWNIYVDLAQQMRYFTTDGSSSADKLTDKTMEEFFWRRAYLQLENLVGSSSHRWEVELALSGMAQGLAAYISDDLFESGPYMSEELPGGDVIMPGGLAQLPASLAANLSPNSVHLSEKVTGIVWDSHHTSARCGQTAGREQHADWPPRQGFLGMGAALVGGRRWFALPGLEPFGGDGGVVGSARPLGTSHRLLLRGGGPAQPAAHVGGGGRGGRVGRPGGLRGADDGGSAAQAVYRGPRARAPGQVGSFVLHLNVCFTVNNILTFSVEQQCVF